MAETVKYLNVEVKITAEVEGDDGAKLVVDETYQKRFAEGTAANQVGFVLQDKTRNLNATSEVHDVDGLTDFQGAAAGGNNLAMMYFRNLDQDTGDGFTIGATTANGLVNWVANVTDAIKLGPDGLFLLISPVDKYAITAATGDKLKVASDDNSNYRFILAGDK